MDILVLNIRTGPAPEFDRLGLGLYKSDCLYQDRDVIFDGENYWVLIRPGNQVILTSVVCELT